MVAFLANGKYYFRATDWCYPFAGGGIGFANALYSGGNLKGSAGAWLFSSGGHGIPLRVGRVPPAVQVSRRNNREKRE